MNLVSRDDLANMSDYYTSEGDGAEVLANVLSPKGGFALVLADSAQGSVPVQTRAKCWLFISYLIAFGAVAGR